MQAHYFVLAKIRSQRRIRKCDVGSFFFIKIMVKEKAMAFLFDATHGKNHCKTLYRSKCLQKLLDMNDGELFFIYAIIDTASGETLMNMDWSYEHEPIIIGRFIHLEFFLRFHWNKQVVDLDQHNL